MVTSLKFWMLTFLISQSVDSTRTSSYFIVAPFSDETRLSRNAEASV